MANWATTNYVIEGNPKSLERIYDAILHPAHQEGSDNSWEGNVLLALDKDIDIKSVGYLRGFLYDNPELSDVLRFSAEEAWGRSDFGDALMNIFNDIKVYWITEEPGMGIYQTNDEDCKYFPDRFYVETRIDGSYESNYVSKEEFVYQWLSTITKGEVKTKEDVESFNAKHEEDETDEDNYIMIHEFEVV